jgi:hypothetical protein
MSFHNYFIIEMMQALQIVALTESSPVAYSDSKNEKRNIGLSIY